MATTTSEAPVKTKWTINGRWFEFCSCNPGCSCNFAGFPSTPGGGCKAFCAISIDEGKCGDIDLSGINCSAAFDWPGAIHEGNGKAFFVLPPDLSDRQVEALSQIFTGALGGQPFEILGTTYQVAGLARADTLVEDSTLKSSFSVPGVGGAQGDTLKNPVTGEDNIVDIVLGKGLKGFIWHTGECGQGSFRVDAGPINLDYKNTNYIYATVSWGN